MPFTFGGTNSDRVEAAPILDSDGNLGPSADASCCRLPWTRRGASALVAADSVFLIGGETGGVSIKTSQRASFNSSGGLSASELTGKSIGIGRKDPQVFVVGNRLYMQGGVTSSGLSRQVFSTTVDENGAFQDLAYTGMEEAQSARDGGSATVAYDKALLLGGNRDNSSNAWVNAFTFDASDNLVAYGGANALSMGGYKIAMFVTRGYLYTLGGLGYNSNVQYLVGRAAHHYSGLHANFGSIAQRLVYPRMGGAGLTAGQYGHVIGGFNGTNYLGSTEQAKLNEDGSINTTFATNLGGQLITARSNFSVARLGPMSLAAPTRPGNWTRLSELRLARAASFPTSSPPAPWSWLARATRHSLSGTRCTTWAVTTASTAS